MSSVPADGLKSIGRLPRQFVVRNFCQQTASHGGFGCQFRGIWSEINMFDPRFFQRDVQQLLLIVIVPESQIFRGFATPGQSLRADAGSRPTVVQSS